MSKFQWKFAALLWAVLAVLTAIQIALTGRVPILSTIIWVVLIFFVAKWIGDRKSRQE